MLVSLRIGKVKIANVLTRTQCTLANACLGGTFISADFQNIDILVDFSYATDGGYSVSKTFVLDEIPLASISVALLQASCISWF
jgi:hypothetical protein